MLVAPASMHAQGTRQKLKKENQELRNEVDSLKKAMEKLRKEKLVKDSLAKEMIGIYEASVVTHTLP